MSAKIRHRMGSGSLRHTKDFLAAGQYDSRPAPQWMKTLQDKYEKLHVKIESYSQRPPSVTRYSPSFGKGNSLKRTEKLTLPSCRSLSTGSNEHRGWTFSNNQPVQRGNRGMSHADKKSNRVSSDVTNVLYACSGDKARCTKTLDRGNEIENEGSTESEGGEIMNIIDDNKLENNNASISKTESIDSCDRLTQSSNQSNVVKNDLNTHLVNGQGNKRDIDANDNQGGQTHVGGDKSREKSNKSKGNHKSTRRQLKLSSRMSMEARHAISETINAMDDDSTTHKERRESSPNKKIQKSKNKNHEGGVLNDKTDEKTNNRILETCSNVVNEKKDGFKSQCPGDYSEWENFIKYDESDNSTDISKTFSTHGDHDTRMHPCRFGGENVISSTYPNPGAYSNQYKGTGRYAMRMHRERTFEITPVGFDVRYRDTIAIGQPDNHAPTSEIRAQAVTKCTEWLKKYAPH